MFQFATMRMLAARLSPYLYRAKIGNVQSRNFSSPHYRKEGPSLEEEAERKIGWFFKLIFVGTATVVAYNMFPYMGENLMRQSVSLLRVKDPLFKRMGASRLSRFAINDEKRMQIVEMGGAEELLNMLGAAKDERTQKEALKALLALSPSDEAVGVLYRAGATSVIQSTPDSSEDADIMKYKLNLLNRFRELRYDVSS
ncbi:hypothetical protein NMG60_11018335 [Bertholletia excelsa]